MILCVKPLSLCFSCHMVLVCERVATPHSHTSARTVYTSHPPNELREPAPLHAQPRSVTSGPSTAGLGAGSEMLLIRRSTLSISPPSQPRPEEGDAEGSHELKEDCHRLLPVESRQTRDKATLMCPRLLVYDFDTLFLEEGTDPVSPQQMARQG